MAILLSEFLRDINIDENTLSDLLKWLGHDNFNLKTRSTLPEDITYTLYALSYNGDMFELINKIIKDEELKKNDTIPLKNEIGSINLNRIRKSEFYKGQQISISHFLRQTFHKLWTKEIPIYDKNKSFWIDELYLINNSEINSVKVGNFSITNGRPLYSVFIGANGVGKSILLSDIVDFFIDLHLYKKKKYDSIAKYKGKLRAVRYHIDNQECFIVRANKSYIVKIGNYIRPVENLNLPLIVASHFGPFDKFHNQSVNNVGKTKYDIDSYKYVGAHINGNIISSSAIAFRLLFSLINQMNENKLNNIKSIFDFINYDSVVSLQYSLVVKRRKSDVMTILNDSSDDVKQLIDFYARKLKVHYSDNTCNIDFNNFEASDSVNKELSYLYRLKQHDLIKNVRVLFYKDGKVITSDEMSSGEFAVLANILSISAAVNNSHTLVLLDEPEISLHPNWQMSFIEILNNALKNRACHVLVATHSHMIVSDLPMNKSSVIQMERDEKGSVSSQLISSSTYGWSAEEVLFKVFKTATDRNRYFGECISSLLEKIGNNDIKQEEVCEELNFLRKISEHLSDVDPMKMVLDTIVKAYKS